MDYEFTDEQLQKLGCGVAAVAEEIFKQCLGEDNYDFGVQHLGWDCAIFGGTNRLIWRPETGWYIDEPYCTERFIRKFKELDFSNLI